MASGERILIVEDEEEWCGIYMRAVHSYDPGRIVCVAHDLVGAEHLIEETRFAMAFVDIGLDVTDDRNVDGLRVMEKIRAMGDQTSIVVVTGRSGQDVLAVTRDAIKKYGAYDTVAKHSVTPSDIRMLLEEGLEGYRRQTAAELGPGAACRALRGDVAAYAWDDQVLRTTRLRGGVRTLYDFLDKLLDGYLPVVPSSGGAHVQIDHPAGLVHGVFWSRAVAAAILVCFGAEEDFDRAIHPDGADSGWLAKYMTGDQVNKLSRQGVKGAVLLLRERPASTVDAEPR